MFTVTIVLMWAEVSGTTTSHDHWRFNTGDQTAERNDSWPSVWADFRSLWKWFAVNRDVGPLRSRFLPYRIWGTFYGLCSAGSMQGALGTLFPAAASKLYPEQRISSLTRNQTWRDIGAAAGPFLTGVLLAVFSPEDIHLITMGCFLVALGWFFFSGDCRRLLTSFSGFYPAIKSPVHAINWLNFGLRP